MTDIVDRLFDSDEANTLTNQAAREIERLRELVKAAYVEGALDFGGFCDKTHTAAEDRYSGSDVARWVDDVDAWESDNAG